MNEARPDFDAEAYRAGGSEPEGLEVDLARLCWHHPDIHEVVAPILAGTHCADAKHQALHLAILSGGSRRNLIDRLVAASVSASDASVLAASVCDPELLDHPDRALPIAQSVALQRFEAEIIRAAKAGDFAAVSKAFAELETRKASFAGDDEYPFRPRGVRAPEAVPPRRWLYGRAYLRKCVSALVAPGGSAKSIIAMVEALAMATGRHDLLHHRAIKPRRVLYWNLEDPIDEIERRFAAVATHFGIAPEEYEGRLFFESGHDTPLKVATADRTGFRLNNAALSKLKRTIIALELDVITIDPIVSAHGVPENDNNAVDAVIKAFAAVAAQTNCAILLVHHARKSLAGQARELEADDARGAAAFVDGCRIVRLAQRMTKDDAENLGIEDGKRWRYIRIVGGKINHAPPAETSEWVELQSVLLGNGDDDDPGGDQIGVPVTWKPPGLTEGLPSDIIAQVQAKARGAKYRADQRANAWFGKAIAPLCQIDPTDKAGKKRLVKLIDTWIENDILVIVEKDDGHRRTAKFIGVPGIDDGDHDDDPQAYSRAKDGE